ncbi:MAG: hydrolase 76 protein [Cirrosporium novae-zelandiae]|nr:MAG: hydrolase 76 protein [Cirrosporium novae-zelandiae]
MRTFTTARSAALVVSAIASRAAAISLDVDSTSSIKSAASTIASGLYSYYDSSTEGGLPSPYYWWEAGAMWGGFLHYWHYTGDTTYNDVLKSTLVSQFNETTNDFMPWAERYSEGNDDQAFWGFDSMAAAEFGFSESSPSWITVTENLFNSQARRWDTTTCGGGLKWQIYTWNNGYDYKNSVSNGAFFNIAARLAAYTGNDTYVEWAEKVWTWMNDVGLMDSSYNVFDGTDDTDDCSTINKYQWTYNVAMMLHGSAVLENYLSSSTWKTRAAGLLDAFEVFVGPYDNSTNIMYEAQCEKSANCSQDEQSFKAFAARWLAKTIQLSSWTKSTIMPWLKASAKGAAASCSGGDDGVTCGSKWYIGGWDGKSGVGQQLAALEVIQSLLVGSSSSPSSEVDSDSSSSSSTSSSTKSSSTAKAATTTKSSSTSKSTKESTLESSSASESSSSDSSSDSDSSSSDSSSSESSSQSTTIAENTSSTADADSTSASSVSSVSDDASSTVAVAAAESAYSTLSTVIAASVSSSTGRTYSTATASYGYGSSNTTGTLGTGTTSASASASLATFAGAGSTISPASKSTLLGGLFMMLIAMASAGMIL